MAPSPHWTCWAARLRAAQCAWRIVPGLHDTIRTTDGRLPSQVISGSLDRPFAVLHAEGATTDDLHALSLWEHGEVPSQAGLDWRWAPDCYAACGIVVERSRGSRRLVVQAEEAE
jgi:hypothetical protein